MLQRDIRSHSGILIFQLVRCRGKKPDRTEDQLVEEFWQPKMNHKGEHEREHENGSNGFV